MPSPIRSERTTGNTPAAPIKPKNQAQRADRAVRRTIADGQITTRERDTVYTGKGRMAKAVRKHDALGDEKTRLKEALTGTVDLGPKDDRSAYGKEIDALKDLPPRTELNDKLKSYRERAKRYHGEAKKHIEGRIKDLEADRGRRADLERNVVNVIGQKHQYIGALTAERSILEKRQAKFTADDNKYIDQAIKDFNDAEGTIPEKKKGLFGIDRLKGDDDGENAKLDRDTLFNINQRVSDGDDDAGKEALANFDKLIDKQEDSDARGALLELKQYYKQHWSHEKGNTADKKRIDDLKTEITEVRDSIEHDAKLLPKEVRERHADRIAPDKADERNIGAGSRENPRGQGRDGSTRGADGRERDTDARRTDRSSDNERKAPRTYTVQQGDSLWMIADKWNRKHDQNVTWNQIYDANRAQIQQSADLIYVGQKFKMPASSGSGTDTSSGSSTSGGTTSTRDTSGSGPRATTNPPQRRSNPQSSTPAPGPSSPPSSTSRPTGAPATPPSAPPATTAPPSAPVTPPPTTSVPPSGTYVGPGGYGIPTPAAPTAPVAPPAAPPVPTTPPPVSAPVTPPPVSAPVTPPAATPATPEEPVPPAPGTAG